MVATGGQCLPFRHERAVIACDAPNLHLWQRGAEGTGRVRNSTGELQHASHLTY